MGVRSERSVLELRRLTFCLRERQAVRIDRCVCSQQTFAALKTVADESDATTIEQLQEHVEFGRDCQLCHAYVRCMLETGQVVFAEIINGHD